MAKRGGACASLAERGRLRRPERGDYLSFAAHQRELVAGAPHRTAPRRVASSAHRAEAFSLSGAYTYGRMRARTIHGSSAPIIILLIGDSHRLDTPPIAGPARRSRNRDRSRMHARRDRARARARFFPLGRAAEARFLSPMKRGNASLRAYARATFHYNVSAGCKWRSGAFENADIEGRATGPARIPLYFSSGPFNPRMTR